MGCADLQPDKQEYFKLKINPHRLCRFDTTESHIRHLEDVFALIDTKPQAKICDAITGIVTEGEGLIEDYQGSTALDPALIAVA